MSSTSAISATLQAKLPCKELYIRDFSNCGCGQKFEVWVVSEKFEGLSRLERHQLIQEILADEIAKIHAITIKAYTPDAKRGEVTEEFVNCLATTE